MKPDSPRCTRAIHIARLALAISACSDFPRTATASRPPAPDPAHRDTASAGFAGTAPAESVGTLSPRSSAEDAGGPPPPSTREIRGYFTDPNTRSSLRLWKGPNDRAGFERLTRFTVEVDGTPQYSRAVSAVELTGICRSRGKGLDQLLFSFHPKRPGGAAVGVLRYDTNERKFRLGFAPKDARIDCAGDRSLFSEGTPAVPCTCPWWDGPDDHSGAAAAPADGRDILILPEETGGPAFTRAEPGSFPEGD